MKKYYQKEWHNIYFKDFWQLDANNIAAIEFYQKFYQEFFRRYSSVKDMPAKWLRLKELHADFIFSRLKKTDAVLSIGGGLGYIDSLLIGKGIDSLDFIEVSIAFRDWLRQFANLKNIYIGSFPDSLPPEKQYDYIYVSAFDYCFNDAEWLYFSKQVYDRLKPKGKFLVISASFDDGMHDKLWMRAKHWTKLVLHWVKLRHLGQFWGYLRTKNDYVSIMQAAGFKSYTDGFINNKHYFIEGWKE